MQPLNRMATRRFLREARAKVWANAVELSLARRAYPDSYARRLAELEDLCGKRVADLVRPGPVLIRLAVGGFGVRLAAGGAGGAPHEPVCAARPVVPGVAPSARSCGVSRSHLIRGRSTRCAWAVSRPPSGSPITGGTGRGFWSCPCLWSAARSAWTGSGRCTGPGLVLRANQLWAPHEGDAEGARRCMSRFYGLLRLTYGEL